jgi:GTPase Era involved in 16S rRNA processing
MKAEFSQFRERILQLFLDLHDLGRAAGDEEMIEVASGLIRNVNAPFLFVVVGEVKSGKSSFINALLGEDLCAVAPDPCTDVIRKIVHAERPFEREVSELVREVGRPVEVLREIAIVDTPGTNSIIDKHQEITERFIPESDLVLFVFSAINPYSKTSWDLFRFVHQRWRKKIVFVLQQADRASREELLVNRSRVEELARQNGMEDPRVFEVSAKLALEGVPDSGIDEVWSAIRETVTGGRHYLLKMESLLNTAASALERIAADLVRLREVVESDRSEAARIESSLGSGKESALREIDVLKARLLQAYIRVAEETVDEFEAGLAVPSLIKNSLKGVFSRRNTLKEWLDDLIRRFNDTLSRKADQVGRETSEVIAERIAGTAGELLEVLRRSGQEQSPAERRLDGQEALQRRRRGHAQALWPSPERRARRPHPPQGPWQDGRPGASGGIHHHGRCGHRRRHARGHLRRHRGHRDHGRRAARPEHDRLQAPLGDPPVQGGPGRRQDELREGARRTADRSGGHAL